MVLKVFILDLGEHVEVQPVIGGVVHRLLSDGLEDLTTREVTQVAGVVMTHQQLRRALSHFANAGDVFLGRREVSTWLRQSAPK